ncbi:serine hydrolase domain-containing protein [Flavivirga aquatica]|uniref:serine hydrolase domain-containing protein n=1 Tax=Flavivirga aquatica TaxID=1849968 RepID=UPI0009F6772F|nr:serine hydrolase domain-containing protein [Flavivirga aquatica]
MFKYFFLALILCSNFLLNAQQDIILEKELEQTLISQGLTGAVWSTVLNGEITTGAVGLKNIVSKEKLSSTDKVQVGSITKTLIALGILRLSSQNKLTIDAPVNTIVPNLQLNNPWATTNPITVRDLLNHTSGLQDAKLWQIFSTKITSTTPLKSIVSEDISVLKVRTKPGTRFSYSNIGYTILGIIIEEITGESYESYLHKNLLAPLGMKHSTFQFTSQTTENADESLAMGHFEDGSTQENVPMHIRAAGQFTTTAHDMALLAKFLLGNGSINEKPFIKKELLNQMGEPTTTDANKHGLSGGYQFGFNHTDRHGVLGYYHSGNIIGYRATFHVFPKEKKAFFISFNMDSEIANYQKFNKIFIDYLKIEKPKKQEIQNSLPNNIEDYYGFYRLNPVRFEVSAYFDLLFNSIKVDAVDNKLKIASLQKKSYYLLPVGENLFKVKNKVKASHVLYEDNKNQIISNGLVTYEKVSILYLSMLWFSFTLGLVGIILVISRGFYLLIQNKLFKKNQILTVPFSAIACLLIPIPFLLTQSILNLGDMTMGNVLLTIVTGIIPLAMIFGLIKARKNKPLKIDVIAILFILQWSIILAYWNLIPFKLWA